MLNLRAKLTSAVEDHAGKYCHSYNAETGVYEIPSVQHYENNITKWRGQIREAFVLLDDIMRNIKESSMTMELFLQNYPRVVHYMGLSLDVFPRVFNALKDWVTADEAYIRCEKLLRARDERRQCRKRQLTLMDASSKMAAELSNAKQELDRSLQQFYHAGGRNNTNSAKVKLLGSSNSLSYEIARLEKKMNSLNAELRTVKIERMAAQKEFHKMQVLVEKNAKLEMDIQYDAYDASQDVHDLDEERRVLGEKVMALARIRAIKTDPRTVKVIYSEGYTPGRKFDVPAELEEACRVAALEIGKDWPAMPPSPRREPGNSKSETGGTSQHPTDAATGQHRLGGAGGGAGRAVRGRKYRGDVMGVAGGVAIGGVDDDDCPTYRSLDRWQRVSQEASVNALSRVTRSMRTVGDPEVSGSGGDKHDLKVITVN
ncbi:hypothetical protein PoB_000396400 [Plakobranchus ocellatus]|uniref:Uncharacterized protein n=1 Tax=Plakobranchus ocellatus TaxID=259542 RepID=A0AAV3Y393_9GAST|nr:hypothetical protein PoB_000396400 [Plakobranchus ocellatus]